MAPDYNETQLPLNLMSGLEELKTTAFLIIKDDTLVYEKYWEEYDTSSISGSFSMAKSFISTLIGVALFEGKIKSVDEPVGNYLTTFKDGAKKKITLKHLLMMSSGLNWDESYSGAFSITTEAYYGTDLEALIARLEVEEIPGKHFTYRSGDTQILSFVLEAATGMSVSQYAQEKLWEPMGFEKDALWSLDHQDGHEKAFCCINTSAREFARLGKLYLHKGKWNEKRIISEDYYVASVTPNEYLNDNCDYYGYQWWIYDDSEDDFIFYARGILGQFIVVIPSRNIVMVRLGHERGDKTGNHHYILKDMIEGIDELYPKESVLNESSIF